MKKMKWFCLVILFVLLLPQVALAKWKTPYHSVDGDNFDDVVKALEKPEWLANYSVWKFSYESNQEQFGQIDYWQTAEEMFANKKGDCKGWTVFQKKVLQAHNYNAEIWVTYGYDAKAGGDVATNSAHAICIFPYKGKWAYMQNGEKKNSVFKKGFNSFEEAVKGPYKDTTTWFISEEDYYNRLGDEYKVKDRKFTLPTGPKFLGSERLSFHNHLTEAMMIVEKTGFRAEVFVPGLLDTQEYIESPHKEAIGYLYPIQSSLLKGIGGSISGHGFYSDQPKTHKWMYSIHLVFPYVGITGNTGDFQGVDIDINPINYSFLKYYVCFRNGKEVIDHKLKVNPWKYIEIIGEKNDEDLNFGVCVGPLEHLIISVKFGKEKSISLNAYERLSLNFSPESVLASVRIKF